MTDLASGSNLKSFKALIDKFKQLDIVTKELTLFDVGARGHFENPTTELLSFFLDKAKDHNLGDCFFKGVKSLLESKNKMASLGHLGSVETEVSTTMGKRIDLLLETVTEIIIVECKIQHDQNNPFEDYSKYGDQRRQKLNLDKELIKLVLCLDGSISNDLKASGWYGISYLELTQSIEPHLAQVLLDNPYNKWGLFAREFLLHLKGLDSMSEISKDEIDFLTENINDYFELSAYLYETIIPKIATKIETELNSNVENFSCRRKIGRWYSYEPYISFSNKGWNESSSNVVLCIRKHKANKMSFTIHVDIFNKLGISSDQAYDLLKEYEAESGVYKDEADGRNIWRVMWKYNQFDIEQVSERILKLIQVLNKYENDKHQLSHRSII